MAVCSFIHYLGFFPLFLQVLKVKLELLSHLAQNAKFSCQSAEFVLADLIDKVGDVKNGAAAQETLSCISEACSLEYVSEQVRLVEVIISLPW